MSYSITFLLVILLVPIIPSYFLFKFLPSSAIVSGPLKGLKINLSGGFAAYFVIFLILITVRATFMSTTYEKWKVNGRFLFPDAPGIIYVDPRYVTLSVPSLRSDADGNFAMDFLRTSDGEFDYPHMYISFPGYVAEAFWLGPKDQNDRNENLPIRFDAKNRVIDIGTVKLVKIAAASASNAPNSPGTNPYAVSKGTP